MRYKGRELRRLWEVRLYKGDPDAKKPKTKTETCIAFNAIEAVRLFSSQQASEPPKDICYVTWDDPPLRIEDTAGPTDEEAIPTLATASESIWGF